MRIHKSFVCTILIAFIIQVVAISSALAATSITKASFPINPITASPGSSGYIQINLANVGKDVISHLKITVASIDKEIEIDQVSSVDIGGLAVGDTNSALFRFKVLGDTPVGFYRIDFGIANCQESVCSDSTQSAIINVQSQPEVQIASVNPTKLNLGANTTLALDIANAGESDISNVVITWEEPTGSILPIGSGNRVIIPSISHGQQVSVPFNIIANPTSAFKVYPVYITIQYYDKTGALQTVNTTVGLSIGGSVDFILNMQDFSAGVLSLSLANVGIDAATSVSVTVPEQNGFSINGAKSVFIGNLNAGDSTSASFNLVPFSNRTSTLSLFIDYTDTAGLRTEIQKSLQITPLAGSFAGRIVQGSGYLQNGRAGTQSSGNYNIYYAAAAVVIIAAVYFVFFRKKRKN